MRALVVSALVLTATPALAARPEGVAGEVALAGGEDLAALCDELGERPEARSAIYVMGLPPRGFTFSPWDSRKAKLSVDASRGFRGALGGWELVLHDLKGGAAP